MSKGRGEEALSILRDGAGKNGLDPEVIFPKGCVLADEEKDESNFAELLSVRFCIYSGNALWELYIYD